MIQSFSCCRSYLFWIHFVRNVIVGLLRFKLDAFVKQLSTFAALRTLHSVAAFIYHLLHYFKEIAGPQFILNQIKPEFQRSPKTKTWLHEFLSRSVMQQMMSCGMRLRAMLHGNALKYLKQTLLFLWCDIIRLIWTMWSLLPNSPSDNQFFICCYLLV